MPETGSHLCDVTSQQELEPKDDHASFQICHTKVRRACSYYLSSFSSSFDARFYGLDMNLRLTLISFFMRHPLSKQPVYTYYRYTQVHSDIQVTSPSYTERRGPCCPQTCLFVGSLGEGCSIGLGSHDEWPPPGEGICLFDDWRRVGSDDATDGHEEAAVT